MAKTFKTSNALIGGENRENWLGPALKKSLSTASHVDIIVSFLMESGVNLILDDLKIIADKGVPIRILTGNYLNITEPSALYLIETTLGDKVDLRFYNDQTRSFHPKSYILEQKDFTEIYIGSSNLSKSALSEGIEWNYRIDSRNDSASVKHLKESFDDLFLNHSVVVDDEVLKNYSKNWHRPKIYQDLEAFESRQDITPEFRPRNFQIEALAALENTRNEGADKALVQAATGTGKTFLAAFDSKNFKRVLFVAHRNEILTQAAKTFSKVHENKSQGFFTGNRKDLDSDILFASVSSLGQERYLNSDYFLPTDFDYIIIDEFHHAVAGQYQKIINYFRPKFLLGLTATPERLDHKNIFKICDYNVPYQIDLFEAINKGMLAPYHYYGIYDDTNYKNAVFKNGRYQEESLDKLYLNNTRRNELILKNYLKHNPKSTLAFCSSKKHAESMAKFFSKNNIPSAAVYSGQAGEYFMDRAEALKKLKTGEIKVIFCVDMFNEGLDVPDIDCVLFLRPTQSPIVFYQQLGRGLRKSKEKKYLTVLDFLGNYENVFRIPSFLNANEESDNILLRNQAIKNPAQSLTLPDDCFVDFDLEIIDLLKEVESAQLSIKDRIIKEYYRIKEALKHRPTHVELFTEMSSEIYELAFRLKSGENPFKNYYSFLNELDELNAEEKEIYNSRAYEFLHLVETTSMTRVYKMPVLSSFLGEKSVIKEPTKEEILNSWKRFFKTRRNYKDLSYIEDVSDLDTISDKTHLNKIKTMPIKHLIKSGQGFFEKTSDALIKLADSLDPFISSPTFYRAFKDIIDYRTIDYYQKKYYQENGIS